LPEALEDEIVELRKHLAEEGLDAGAHTIAYHLTERRGMCPSVATIWRILSRRGFVTPQPQKRPKSSYVRFEADQPNERWQADITHWKLISGTEVEIRRDKVDITGVITLRHNSRLHHIGLGRRLIGTRVLVLVADLDVRVLTEDGELLRVLTLDPSRDYQPHGRA
jgi:transposase InsO family protein